MNISALGSHYVVLSFVPLDIMCKVFEKDSKATSKDSFITSTTTSTEAYTVNPKLDPGSDLGRTGNHVDCREEEQLEELPEMKLLAHRWIPDFLTFGLSPRFVSRSPILSW